MKSYFAKRDKLQAMINYFSSVKVWITSSLGELSVFKAPKLKVMKRGLFKKSKHVPSRAPSVTPTEFKMIIKVA